MAKHEHRIARTTAQKLVREISRGRQTVEHGLAGAISSTPEGIDDDIWELIANTPPEMWSQLPEEWQSLLAEISPPLLHNGWQKAPYDPMQLVAACRHVRLKEGFKLESYQYVSGGNGNGFVFVIPEGETLPKPPRDLEFAWSESGDTVLLKPESGMPEWVRTDVDAFLEGDKKPASYFEVSMLSRELHELGAMWHGCSWSDTTVLITQGAVDKVIAGKEDVEERWEWQDGMPCDWRPAVCIPDIGPITVEFYTYSGLGWQSIQLHRDIFTEGYSFRTEMKAVADGERGYVH